MLHHWLGWMAKIQFLPALLGINLAVLAVLLLFTLVFGRIYCSTICPLGTLQDIIAWGHNKKKKNRYSYSAAKNTLRYALTLLMAISILFGTGVITGLLAPYSSYGRIASNLLRPLYIGGNNLLALIGERLDSYTFYPVEVWIKSLPTFLIAAGTFILVFILAWRNGRTYCNTICPVGTVLGFVAKFSWKKVHLDGNQCVGCSLCAKICKAACIDYKNHRIDYSRCVVCGDCLNICSKNALSYTHLRSKATEENSAVAEEKIDQSKRLFLGGIVLAAGSVALAQKDQKVDGILTTLLDKKKPERETQLTPPGSISAQNMSSHCTSCQLCITECPNNVLRPSTHLTTLMQPTMGFEKGYCKPGCTRCSKLCPTGAIRPITKTEKATLQIGHAVWIGKNCIPAQEGIACGDCAGHCPTEAISMIRKNADDSHSPLIPLVNEAKCIGCGACENICPAQPYKAIYVEGNEIHRTIQ